MTTIACRILGIRNHPELSIPWDAFQDVENGISAVRHLLASFGGYELNDVPQFQHDRMLLSVASTDHDALTFNAAKFDVFARNIAEFIDAKCEGRNPLLNHEENGVSIEGIENICRSLKSLGKCVFSVDGMPDIKLTNRRKWRTNNRDDYITIVVESTTVVAALECSNRAVFVSDAQASNFSLGDSIGPDRSNNATPIRRVIGSLVEVIDDTGSTGDMFSADNGNE